MLEDLVNSIRQEATRQQARTTRRFGAADGSEYIVMLPNWRWRVLDQLRPDDERMKSLLDLVLITTSIWKRGQAGRPAEAFFKACLDDNVDGDVRRLPIWKGGRRASNENYRTPWNVRVTYGAETDNRGGLKDYFGLVFVPEAECENRRGNGPVPGAGRETL